jgi:hypothetical protein
VLGRLKMDTSEQIRLLAGGLTSCEILEQRKNLSSKGKTEICKHELKNIFSDLQVKELKHERKQVFH